jgi:hypothetical protein
MNPAVTVLVEDQSGNLTSSTSSITLTVTTNPCGGSPAVTNGTVNAVSGTATFSSLQISKECIGYALTATDATDGGITVLSSTFTVSALVTSSANILQDAATDSGGSGVNSVTYYYCSGFTTSCTSGTPIGASTTSPNYQVNWTSLPANGSYSIVAVGTDNATNSTSSTPAIPVTVDGTGPTGGSISVPNYANTLSVTITTTNFSDSISGMASNVITRSNGQAPSAGVCPASGYAGATTVTSPDAGVINGNCYEYTLKGTANDGTSASVTSSPVLVDTVAPVTTITLNPSSPNGTNGWYDGTSPTFTLSATDSGGSGVATTYYEIDGGTQTVYPGSAVTIPDGSAQTISYWSVDNAGNTETTHTTAALKIDTVAPTGSITQPSANATVSGSAVTVASNSADSGSGVASAQFQYSAHTANTWTSIGTDTSSPYSLSWNTTSLSPGSYDLRVITIDAAGNSTTSAIVTVTVQLVGTYSGSTNGDIPASPSTTYYGLDTPSSTGSGTNTANTLTPGTGTTLTGGTFSVSGSSGSRSWTVTVGIVTSGVWAATSMTCNIPTNSSSCTLPGSVSVSAMQSINLQVKQNAGSAGRTGSWSVNYTQP